MQGRQGVGERGGAAGGAGQAGASGTAVATRVTGMDGSLYLQIWSMSTTEEALQTCARCCFRRPYHMYIYIYLSIYIYMYV